MHHRIASSVVALSCIVALVGCGATNRAANAPPTPSPAATRTPPTPSPIAAATVVFPTIPATATPDLRPVTTPFMGVTITARSTPAAVGMSYPFDLLTHCGVNFAVDFGGSYWEATISVYPGAGPKLTPIADPTQRGTMTLLGPDNAMFEYPNGRIPFRRIAPTKVLPGLCA